MVLQFKMQRFGVKKGSAFLFQLPWFRIGEALQISESINFVPSYSTLQLLNLIHFKFKMTTFYINISLEIAREIVKSHSSYWRRLVKILHTSQEYFTEMKYQILDAYYILLLYFKMPNLMHSHVCIACQLHFIVFNMFRFQHI